jgi:endonuclease-3
MSGLRPKLDPTVAQRKLAKEILRRLDSAMPDARCELFYLSPYQLLCSVVLSAQATDKQVNKVMTPIYQRGFTPASVLSHGEAYLLSQIKSIGLSPTKAKNIIKLTNQLVANHQGAVPRSREELEALAGVGRKTANVVLGELYGEPMLAVDTHVFRVGSRLGLHHSKNPEQAEQELLKLIDTSFLPRAGHWFILHGRYTCKAIKPACESCILSDLCITYRQNQKISPKTVRKEPRSIGV